MNQLERLKTRKQRVEQDLRRRKNSKNKEVNYLKTELEYLNKGIEEEMRRERQNLWLLTPSLQALIKEGAGDG